MSDYCYSYCYHHSMLFVHVTELAATQVWDENPVKQSRTPVKVVIPGRLLKPPKQRWLNIARLPRWTTPANILGQPQRLTLQKFAAKCPNTTSSVSVKPIYFLRRCKMFSIFRPIRDVVHGASWDVCTFRLIPGFRGWLNL